MCGINHVLKRIAYACQNLRHFKKLGLENREVLAKAKELGIDEAKIASSSLPKLIAEKLEEALYSDMVQSEKDHSTSRL